jgi:formamidase
LRIRVDAGRPLAEEPGSGHNRWYPELEPIARVAQGKELTLELRDGIDGQLTPTSTHADVLGLELGWSHPLTGPVYVEGAEPGDVLEVELVGYEWDDFGATALYPGFGFLADLFPEPYLVKWSIRDGVARSEELPGVSVPADPFAGVLGVAPSFELMAEQRRREEELEARGFAVVPPAPEHAVPASAAPGLRTIPPRENGGNLDVRRLVAGSKLLLPVFVPGALFSAGDLHFAQGEGEVCGTGIEIAGAVTVRLRVLRGQAWRPRFPAFEAPARQARAAFVTTGLSLADDGSAEWMDVGLAARRALLELVDHLVAVRGLGREAAYALASVAADLQLSEVVDVPYPVVSASLPLDLFEGSPG